MLRAAYQASKQLHLARSMTSGDEEAHLEVAQIAVRDASSSQIIPWNDTCTTGRALLSYYKRYLTKIMLARTKFSVEDL